MGQLVKVVGSKAYLIAVFLNAFVDLGHKIIIQNTVFKVYDGQEQIILSAIVNGLILLPFILLLSPAGYVADKYPKNIVLKASAWAAVIITLGITFCYYMGLFWLAFAMTLLLAVQSAFYSPAKYGYIKYLYGTENLTQANGWVQSTTIVAILAGTVIYSVFFELLYPPANHNPAEIIQYIAPLGWLLVINAVFELIMMYRLPTKECGDIGRQFPFEGYFKGKLLKENINLIKGRKIISLTIIGLATFWSAGQVMLATFPAFAKEHFAVSNTIVIQGVLACAGLGIMIGSWLAARISSRYIETGLLPLAAVGIALSLWCLPMANSMLVSAVLFVTVGIMGGLFIVPLNALMQFYAGEHDLGRILAVNNWLQNIAMGSFLILTALFALWGYSSQLLLESISLVALLGGLYTVFKLRQSWVRVLLWVFCYKRFSISVKGLSHLPNSGGVFLDARPSNWIQCALLQLATPRPIRFIGFEAFNYSRGARFFFYWLEAIFIKGADTADLQHIINGALSREEVVCRLSPCDELPANINILSVDIASQEIEFRQG